MSDSSQLSSSSTPSDSLLEQELRTVVRRFYDEGRLDDITVKRVRKAAQDNLKLEDGFFKSNAWKDRSKDIIAEEAERAPTKKSEPETSTPVVPKSTSQAKPKQSKSAPEKPKKRAPPVEPKPNKRRKVSEDPALEDEEDSGDLSPAQKKATARSKKSQVLMSDSSNEGGDGKGKQQKSSANAEAAAKDSESEMSVVFDEDPKPKKKRQNADKGKAKDAPKTQKKKPSVSQEPPDPDVEEIKKLQGWLVKCGIRKLWGKELASYDTSNAKIRHLKEMLSNAGMTGRYSNEKAASIRETRELQADLEAVQEGNKSWGKAAEDAEEGEGRPRRRLAKGLQQLNFLVDQSDGDDSS